MSFCPKRHYSKTTAWIDTKFGHYVHITVENFCIVFGAVLSMFAVTHAKLLFALRLEFEIAIVCMPAGAPVAVDIPNLERHGYPSRSHRIESEPARGIPNTYTGDFLRSRIFITIRCRSMLGCLIHAYRKFSKNFKLFIRSHQISYFLIVSYLFTVVKYLIFKFIK